MNKKFYITTPIYYPSANFHIGHCYTTIVADALARFKRLQGYDVFFQTGTDEHGQKIQKKAEAVGLSPLEYVNPIIENAKELWASLDISYDNFIRTTDENHVKSVQKIFNKLYEQGDIYKGKYTGLYCTPCESFWTETQLNGGMCPDCGREVASVKEEAYFLKLSKYQQKLEDYIDKHPDFIMPLSRKNEMINNFLKPGLDDLCVSRTSFNWGIPVDFDEKHVVYVWLDALTNYITSLGYLSADDSKFKKYWPADLHLVGKEIVRFHTIIWPIILMALGLELPKQVFGHGWLIVDGGKISKSKGNYKDPREYINLYGKDAVRYFSLREVPFGNDGSFTEESLVTRINSDLANVLGNLVNRTTGMVNKYFDGIVTNENITDELSQNLINFVINVKPTVIKKMDELKTAEALENIFEIYKKCNKYIDETMPWILAKEEKNKEQLNTVLYNIIESIRIATVMLQAFLPDTAAKIFNQFNTTKTDFSTIEKFGNYKSGTKIHEATVLFQRIDIKSVN